MGGSTGGALAAAVSRGGGLGLLGSADGDPDWRAREVAILTARTDRPWGIGFLSWMAGVPTVERAPVHVRRGVVPPLPVRAGEAVDLITDLPSAADLVPALAAGGRECIGAGERDGMNR